MQSRLFAALPILRFWANTPDMQVAPQTTHVSVEDYIAGEQHSEIKHEYLGGVVYAMAGTSIEHNVISLNFATALRSHLRGGSCRVFMADVKVRLELAGDDVFYYPDIMVACDSRDTDRFFARFPKVLIEVLSPETERTDRREKFLSYTQIETLEEYVLVSQEKAEVTIYRRANNWRPEIIDKSEQKLQLGSIGFSMPLPAVYEGVKI